MSNIQATLDWMRNRQGRVTYSMTYRNGPNSYDCSSAVFYALQAGGFPIPWIGNTDTLFSMEGQLLIPINRSQIRAGDIFVSGSKGGSGGAYGHTGFALNATQAIHCSSVFNGIGVSSNANSSVAAYGGAPVYWYRVRGSDAPGSGGDDPTPPPSGGTYPPQKTAGNYDSSKSSGATSPITVSGWDYSVYNFDVNQADPPHVDGDYIDDFLRRGYSDSPLIGYGDYIKEMADYFGIAVGTAMGMWAKETVFGRSYPGRSPHYNFGCVRSTSDWESTKDGTWNSYGNIKTGIAAWFKLMRYVYVELGYVNYEAVLNRYAPTSDGNTHSTFADKMWGTLKAFGYSFTDSVQKQNRSSSTDDPRNLSAPTSGGGGSGGEPEEEKLIFITDINDGKEYIINQELQEIIGTKITSHKFEDVISEEDLMQKGIEWLTDQPLDIQSLELTFAQLDKINPNYKKKKKGDVITIRVDELNIDVRMRIDRKQFTLDDEITGTINLGRKVASLSDLFIDRR